MKKPTKLAIFITSGAILIASVAFAADNANILLQLKGPPVNSPTFAEKAKVEFNGHPVGGLLSVNNDNPTDTETASLPQLNAGDTLNVTAELRNANNAGGVDDHTPRVSCSRTFTATGPNDLSCGPIEVFFNPNTNSCAIVCD